MARPIHYADDALRLSWLEIARMALGSVAFVATVWLFLVLLFSAGPR